MNRHPTPHHLELCHKDLKRLDRNPTATPLTPHCDPTAACRYHSFLKSQTLKQRVNAPAAKRAGHSSHVQLSQLATGGTGLAVYYRLLDIPVPAL